MIDTVRRWFGMAIERLRFESAEDSNHVLEQLEEQLRQNELNQAGESFDDGEGEGG